MAEITAIELDAHRQRSFGERCGDTVSRVAGTMTFLLFHMFWYGMWMFSNTGLLGSRFIFDPFPYPFLTFVVSLEAIFLSLFILISQNRANRQADRRSQLNLHIDLLAEKESTIALGMLQALTAHFNIDGPDDKEIDTLLKKTDPQELMKQLDETIPHK